MGKTDRKEKKEKKKKKKSRTERDSFSSSKYKQEEGQKHEYEENKTEKFPPAWAAKPNAETCQARLRVQKEGDN